MQSRHAITAHHVFSLQLLVDFEHSHVLHQYSVNAHLYELSQQVLKCLEFLLVDDSINRDVHRRTEPMRIACQFGYILRAVAGSLASAELGCAYINSVSAMVNGSDATFKVLGRCQEFYHS